jgi:hypothetical protein
LKQVAESSRSKGGTRVRRLTSTGKSRGRDLSSGLTDGSDLLWVVML